MPICYDGYHKCQHWFAYVSVNFPRAVVVSFIFAPWHAVSCGSCPIDVHWQKSNGEEMKHSGPRLLWLPPWSGILVANHSPGLALPQLKSWGVCGQKPWVPMPEPGYHQPAEPGSTTTTNSPSFLLEEGQYWTLKLWAANLALPRVRSQSQGVPAEASLLCWGSSELGWGGGESASCLQDCF